MLKSPFAALGLVVLVPAVVLADPVILATSLVRVRADNHFGVTKDAVIMPPVFSPAPVVSTITDTEMGTAAMATNTATYEFTLTNGTAVFDIQTQHAMSVGATGNLTEGFIQFALDEPYVFELSGQWFGTSTDPGEAHQQRTFLRQGLAPFQTQYLEDETRVGAIAALYVNQGDDTGGAPGTFNQVGARLGVLSPGTYSFEYELESTDRDNDQAGSGTATGHVRLVLRKPLAPTEFEAATTGRTVRLSWRASRDATSYHLEAGSAPGLSNLFNGDIGPGLQLQVSIPPGVYYVRLRSRRGLALGPPTAEVPFTIGPLACTAAPPAPATHAATTAGLGVTLGWAPVAGATSYVLEAGTASGVANLVNADVGGRTSFTAQAAGGPFFTRVRAVNACGVSAAASPETSFTLACTPPAPPADAAFTRPPGAVSVSWTASPSATAYFVQVGTLSGLSNVFAGPIGPGTVLTFPANVLPPGIYYLRVLAQSACGTSGPSTELVVTLP